MIFQMIDVASFEPMNTSFGTTVKDADENEKYIVSLI